VHKIVFYASTCNTVRLQRVSIIFRSSSGTLHQTNIYKTEMNYQIHQNLNLADN